MSRPTVRRILLRLLTLIAIAGPGGCMLPEYYEPAGFSSTANRRFEESHIDGPVEP